MGMKDLYNNLAASSVLDPIAVTATATYTDIDLQGFNSCMLLVSLGLRWHRAFRRAQADLRPLR